MGELRDYELWHDTYADPESGLSWRLRTVQRHLTEALDSRSGPVRILSLCAGDGRDVLGVLSRRTDADRVSATLVELHPDIAARARTSAAGMTGIDVRTADAGLTDSLAGAVPADVVLLVGIFGNISTADIEKSIDAAPQLCAPGATLVWSRGRDRDDQNAAIRTRFAATGFAELDYATRDVDSRPALGLVRFDGPTRDLVAGRRLFTFVR